MTLLRNVFPGGFLEFFGYRARQIDLAFFVAVFQLRNEIVQTVILDDIAKGSSVGKCQANVLKTDIVDFPLAVSVISMVMALYSHGPI